MKHLALIFAAALAALPASPAFSQAAGGPNGGHGGDFGCIQVFVAPGHRASVKEIARARTAIVHRALTCEDHYAEMYFGVNGQGAAIAKNKRLARDLRQKGISPVQVLGAQVHRGRLIVYTRAM